MGATTHREMTMNIEADANRCAWLDCHTIDGQRPESVKRVPDGWSPVGCWEVVGAATNSEELTVDGGFEPVAVTVWRRYIEQVPSRDLLASVDDRD